MIKESDILYENGKFWVCVSAKKGFEVYETGITHSTRCAIIGYEGKKGLEIAKLECDKRSNEVKV